MTVSSELFDKNHFLRKYINDMFESVKLYFGVEELSETTKNKIIKICSDSLQENVMHLTNIENDQGEIEFISRKIATVLSHINQPDSDKRPVITGSGSIFSRSKFNETEGLIESLQSDRKKEKKRMFTFEKNTPMYDLLDNIQKVLKVMANSWYGANSQKGFVFYTTWSGIAVTLTGQRLVMHAAMTMEAFLGNNVPFLYESSVYNFIRYVVNEETKFNYAEYINDFSDDIKYSPKAIYKRLIDKCSFEMSTSFKENLLNTLGNLSHEKLVRMYYKNNIYEFLENSKKTCDEILAECFDTEFTDPMHLTESIKEPMELLFEVIYEFISYIYIESDISKIFNTLERKVILVVDTDSTFIYLDPFFKFVKKYYQIDDEQSKTIETRVMVCNVITNICANYTDAIHARLTHNMGVKPEKRKLINMKSEFLYSRMLLTTGKKNYAGNIILQEGKVMEKPDFDMKGLPIKKVSTPKPIRDHFKKILIEDILAPEHIDIFDVISKFESYSLEIKKRLSAGNTDCLKPSKFTSTQSYDDPYRQQPFVGQLIWNYLYKADSYINTFESIYLAKVKDEFSRCFEMPEFIEKFPEEAELLNELFSNDEILNEKGMNVVAMPKYIKQMPEWLVYVLDIDSIITDRLQPAMPLLESLNVYCANYKAKSYITNIISL